METDLKESNPTTYICVLEPSKLFNLYKGAKRTGNTVPGPDTAVLRQIRRHGIIRNGFITRLVKFLSTRLLSFSSSKHSTGWGADVQQVCVRNKSKHHGGPSVY